MPTQPTKEELKRVFRFIDVMIDIMETYDCGYGHKQKINRINDHSYNQVYKLYGKKARKKGPLFATIFNILFDFGGCDEQQVLTKFEKNMAARWRAWQKEKKKKEKRKGKKGKGKG